MKFLLLVFSCLFLSSCAKLLLPYEDEVLCRKGREYGYCGSISDIYKESVERPYRFGIKEEKTVE